MTDPNHPAEAVEPWLHAYYRGADLREAAAIAGVSHQAISNWLKARDIHVRSKKETDELRRKLEIDEHGEAIRVTFLATRNLAATANEVGVSEKAVQQFLDANVPDYKVLAKSPRNRRKNYTTQELIDSLAEAAAAGASPLAHASYLKFVHDSPLLADGRDRPGPQAMGLRFGTWTAALQAAGLPANPRSGPKSELDDVKAVQSVVACWTDLEKPPTVDAYDKWQRNKVAHPSPASVRKFFDSWDLLLVRAWQIRHGISLDPSDADVAIPPGLADAGPGFLPYGLADEEANLERQANELKSHLAGLELAVRNHARIQNRLAEAVRKGGREPLSPSTEPFFDVAFVDADGTLVVAEIKSCNDSNLEGQLRLGVGQILRYSHQLRRSHRIVRPVLVTQLEPPGEWTDLLDSLAIVSISEPRLESGVRALLSGT